MGGFKSLRFDFCVINFDTMKLIFSAKVSETLMTQGFRDIEKERNIKADMLRVRSTDANLKQVISNSQFHFGYVYLPED